MSDEENQAMVKQKTILVKAALEDFLENYRNGVDFKKSIESGERVLWRDAERTFRTTFVDDTEKDLLIEIIRDCKGCYYELAYQMCGLWDSPKVH